MRLSVRFVLPLVSVVGGIAYLSVNGVDFVTTRWFVRDLEARSRLVGAGLENSLSPLLVDSGRDALKKRLSILTKVSENERILALGYCGISNQLEFKTALFPPEVRCVDLVESNFHTLKMVHISGGDANISLAPISYEVVSKLTDGTDQVKTYVGKLVIVHDMRFASARSADAQKYLFALFLGIGLITAFLAVLISRWSMKGWVRSVRALLIGAKSQDLDKIESSEFLPILQDVKNLVQELESNRVVRDDLQLSWSAHALKDVLTNELSGQQVIVVANREPYIHMHDGAGIKVLFPASGLVTAMEPIVRACSGVWIAHGSGSADRDVVDKRDRVAVPPGENEYEIHRIWLTEEEEKGYYYGFANEGMWPLCHIAHTRPIFRQTDWEHYVKVNQKFADAVVKDAESEAPVVLVQDYHLALVPRMIRNKLPNAIIITFWHIPWPNPEAFGICPWREEILDGLLGSSIMGFHIRFHRNNFVDTVDRFLESRIDRESSSISFRGEISLVRSYPISIEWPPRLLSRLPPMPACEATVRARNNIDSRVLIGLGVDRLDYTKGIVERFRAVERLFEKYPEWIGKFSFIQIAAPSRSSIPAYKAFDEEVRTMAARVNQTYETPGYQPIVLKIEHHGPELVYEYMRSATLCFVSSLHDGMNLVAKEYIATREDETGVLLLSMFAGASRELSEALIINPYDTEQCADALHSGLSMPIREQKERMHAMRSFVREFNIYRWAGKMLLDAAVVRRRNRFVAKFSHQKTGFLSSME
jgi:trehalose 6-phosphate synthase